MSILAKASIFPPRAGEGMAMLILPAGFPSTVISDPSNPAVPMGNTTETKVVFALPFDAASAVFPWKSCRQVKPCLTRPKRRIDVKYFANHDALLGYMALTFIEEQTATLIRLIYTAQPDAPLEQLIPAMIDAAVDDWARNPTSRALQGIFILHPVLYSEYSQSSLYVAAALRPVMAAWNIEGNDEDWQRMHLVFGDCAIVLFDRAAKAEPEEQARIMAQLKNLAVAYFRTAVVAI